jgi:hypothetical protein
MTSSAPPIARRKAASARRSARVPDHAPEAFIKHDRKGIPASVVANTVIIHLCIGGLCRRLILRIVPWLESVR